MKFVDVMILPETTEPSPWVVVGQAISELTWPYDPQGITIFTEFQIDFNRLKVVVGCERWRDRIYVDYFDRDDDPMFPPDLPTRIGMYFRNIPALPIGDHIVLSEN